MLEDLDSRSAVAKERWKYRCFRQELREVHDLAIVVEIEAAFGVHQMRTEKGLTLISLPSEFLKQAEAESSKASTKH